MTPHQFKRVDSKGQEIYRLRPAWLSYWGSLLAALSVIGLWFVQRHLFAGLAGSIGIPETFAWAGLAIGLLPIVARVLYHRYTRSYEIENGAKVRLVVGFIARVKREFPISDKVQTDMGQSFVGRIFNYGTLAFWTGDDRSRLVWKDAPDPDKVITFIDRIKAGHKGGLVSAPLKETPSETDGVALEGNNKDTSNDPGHEVATQEGVIAHKADMIWSIITDPYLFKGLGLLGYHAYADKNPLTAGSELHYRTNNMTAEYEHFVVDLSLIHI